MDNDSWIKIEPGGEMPNSCEWVEVKHSLLPFTLEVFYLEGYPLWPTKCATHWRRLSWHFDPLPVGSIYREFE